MINVYINDLLFTSKYYTLLDQFKKSLQNKYNIKDIRKVQTIIGWQISWNWDIGTLKIDQLTFIRNLFKKENLMNYNVIKIFIKAGNFIEMFNDNNYEKADFKTYQHLIGKLIYLSYGTRLIISVAIRQFSKYNINLTIGHFGAAKKVV